MHVTSARELVFHLLFPICSKFRVISLVRALICKSIGATTGSFEGYYRSARYGESIIIMTTACSSFSSFINDENKLTRYRANKITAFEKNEKLIQDYAHKIDRRSEKGYEITFNVTFFVMNV